MVDDNGTTDTTDDTVLSWSDVVAFTGTGANTDSTLDVGETWVFSATDTVDRIGLYTNTASAEGTFTDDLGNTETATDADISTYSGFQKLIEIEGSPQFNFPNDVNKIQPKLSGKDSFTLFPGGYIYWDLYTSDVDLAGIDLTSLVSPYGFDIDIITLWDPGADEDGETVYRIYVSNETDDDTSISLVNNTNIVEYDTILDSTTERARIDLINSDPNISNFNSFNNIQNALAKLSNGFEIDGAIVSTDGTDEKIWKSSDINGTGTGEIPAPSVDALGGDDLLYGENNDGMGSETLEGGADNDVIDGRDGDDVINGDGGNDYLFGGPGDDTIDGGAGNDTLIGSYGTDSLTGGTGADTFILNVGGFTTITDFNAAEGDQIFIAMFDPNDPDKKQLDEANFGDYFEYSGGLLFFDPDGSEADYDAFLLASLTGSPSIDDPAATADEEVMIFTDWIIF
jgi:Ca2+-binding RTX toxin-like protein